MTDADRPDREGRRWLQGQSKALFGHRLQQHLLIDLTNAFDILDLMPVCAVQTSATGLTLPSEPEGSRILSVIMRRPRSFLAVAAASVSTWRGQAALAGGRIT